MTVVWGWTFTDRQGRVGRLRRRLLSRRSLFDRLPLPDRIRLEASEQEIAARGRRHRHPACRWAIFCKPWGLKYTTPTNSGLITSFLVIAAPLFNRMLFGVRTRPLLWAAIGLTMLGMVLLTGFGWTPLALGDLLTLGAAISFGLQVVFLDRYSKHHDTFALTIGQTAMSAVIFLAVWPMTEPITWPSYDSLDGDPAYRNRRHRRGFLRADARPKATADRKSRRHHFLGGRFRHVLRIPSGRRSAHGNPDFSGRFSCSPPSLWRRSCRRSLPQTAGSNLFSPR